jgi:hypothetical protein
MEATKRSHWMQVAEETSHEPDFARLIELNNQLQEMIFGSYDADNSSSAPPLNT